MAASAAWTKGSMDGSESPSAPFHAIRLSVSLHTVGLSKCSRQNYTSVHVPSLTVQVPSTRPITNNPNKDFCGVSAVSKTIRPNDGPGSGAAHGGRCGARPGRGGGGRAQRWAPLAPGSGQRSLWRRSSERTQRGPRHREPDRLPPLRTVDRLGGRQRLHRRALARSHRQGRPDPAFVPRPEGDDRGPRAHLGPARDRPVLLRVPRQLRRGHPRGGARHLPRPRGDTGLGSPRRSGRALFRAPQRAVRQGRIWLGGDLRTGASRSRGGSVSNSRRALPGAVARLSAWLAGWLPDGVLLVPA